MPEGPELHLASLFVNRMCEGVVFTGSVKKSQVSKRPDVPFTSEAYRITAQSRGKEVKLMLTPIKRDEVKHGVKAGNADQPMDIIFHFGMSGFFRFSTEDELPKHAHLHFYSNEKPCRVLSFVDARRFGGWQPNGTWQPDRGPCIMFEYETFRENVLTHLSDRAFDRPICETLLNQKYFNGIGNYLRAEILFRELKYPKDSRLIILYQKPKQMCKTFPNARSWCLFTVHNGACVASGLDFFTDDLKTKIWLQTLQTENSYNKA